MTTIVVRRTECGVLLTCMDGVVIPLTPCCQHAAWIASDGYTACSGCFRTIGDEFTLAASNKTRYLRRDLRALLEAFGCDDAGGCSAQLALHYGAST